MSTMTRTRTRTRTETAMSGDLKTLYKLALDPEWHIFECKTEDNVVTIRLAASTAGPFATIVLEPIDDR